jgi:hypothetical protein
MFSVPYITRPCMELFAFHFYQVIKKGKFVGAEPRARQTRALLGGRDIRNISYAALCAERTLI